MLNPMASSDCYEKAEWAGVNRTGNHITSKQMAARRMTDRFQPDGKSRHRSWFWTGTGRMWHTASHASLQTSAAHMKILAVVSITLHLPTFALPSDTPGRWIR
jgi:hypothetical protein